MIRKIISIILVVGAIVMFAIPQYSKYRLKEKIKEANVIVEQVPPETLKENEEKVIKKEFSQDKMIKEFLQYEPKEYQEYYASKWDVITKNIQNVIKEIRFLPNKKVLSIVTIISPDPENFTSKKIDEEAAKRYKKKTGKYIENLKIKKLSEEETKKMITDFNIAMAEVVDEKLAATVKYSYVDYTVELIKKGNSWEILDIKQLNK